MRRQCNEQPDHADRRNHGPYACPIDVHRVPGSAMSFRTVIDAGVVITGEHTRETADGGA